MEVRELARSIIFATTLEAKLAPAPGEPTDDDPGEPLTVAAPSRPADLRIAASSVRVPAIEGMADPEQRVRILHAFANHELQAVELFAAALLRFPDAPPAFRRGLVRILGEEQRHCRLYVDRLAELGGRFGEHPVSGYFWKKAADLSTPLRFVCGMGLTFESANLDHAVEYARAAREHGDERTAAVIEAVHRDEVGHVAFAWRWLEKLKEPGQPACAAYRANVTWPLRAALAKGPVFHPESRRAAGLAEDFVRMVAESRREEPR